MEVPLIPSAVSIFRHVIKQQLTVVSWGHDGDNNITLQELLCWHLNDTLEQ